MPLPTIYSVFGTFGLQRLWYNEDRSDFGRPQARIGIAERRRPDFVLFAPKQALKYQWYAIELDGSHTESDDERNLELEWSGYRVLSYRPNFQPGGKGYYQEVQRLLEKIHTDMTEVDRDPNTVAVDRDVRSYEPALPF
jgi:hypothetical protein